MGLAIISESTFIDFIEDRDEFENHAKECFKMMDRNEDGVISRDEFNEGFHKLMALECEFRPKEEIENLCQQVFERFDEDKSGNISDQEFQCLIREILMAMARSIGNSPVLVALHSTSFMMKIVQHETSKS
ncbi:uncharacterized protein [Euphorbia lathyris]|uniref:uncharacterized protein n=1 Tax=Euphorbia lathyris TaxID=212925 RepID=UPI0033134B67